MLIKDKVAIVTGAARGIGRAIAKKYSENGAIVYICDVNLEGVKATAKEIQDSTGFPVYASAVNVTKADEINAFVAEVVKAQGRIDVLVNNAGICPHAPLLEMEASLFDKVYEVNVKGVFLFTQAVGKVMKDQKSGKIINMSSCSGKKPTQDEAAYCASKSAINGLTRVTALELGIYGVTCNAICPGATDTEMIRSTFLTSPEIEQEWINKTALKKLGTVDDQAKVALFLASELSDHITGEQIIVSAGEIMTQ